VLFFETKTFHTNNFFL
jgi:hypothetical protein